MTKVHTKAQVSSKGKGTVQRGERTGGQRGRPPAPMDLEFDKAASRLKKEQKARVDRERLRREKEAKAKQEADARNAELQQVQRCHASAF